MRLTTGGLSLWEPRLVEDQKRRAVKLTAEARAAVAAAAWPYYETFRNGGE